MEIHRQPLRLVFGLVVFALGLVACHGSPGGSATYLPSGSSGISSQAQVGVAPNSEERGEIISSCGRHINIMVAGIVNCRFREPGYGDNSPFTLHNHTQGLIVISPTSGTSDTKFTITGVLVGTGFFIVKDKIGHHLTVFVRVRL